MVTFLENLPMRSFDIYRQKEACHHKVGNNIFSKHCTSSLFNVMIFCLIYSKEMPLILVKGYDDTVSSLKY